MLGLVIGFGLGVLAVFVVCALLIWWEDRLWKKWED